MSSTAYQAWNGFTNPLTSWFQNGPAAPGSFSGAGSDQTVTLTWTAPASDSPVLYYVVSGDHGLADQIIPAGTLTAVYSGLTNGTLYAFSIYAVSAVCAGSTATTTATPSSFTLPTNVGLTSTVLTTWAQTQSCTVAQDFTAPNGDPGYTLTNVTSGGADYHNIFISPYSGNTLSQNCTKFGVVAKKGTVNYLGIGHYSGFTAVFDLNAGTAGATTGTGTTSSITDLGGGWYYCEMQCASGSRNAMQIACGNSAGAAYDGANYPLGGINSFAGTLQVYHAVAYN